uniref:BUB1 mitotic checkpoint serine/threonine kinase n=1 Tax=Petromyzon marinus TaxID=7757 RepID=S4RXY0_PETMA
MWLFRRAGGLASAMTSDLGEDGNGWELSKENVRLLPGGRSAAAINDAFLKQEATDGAEQLRRQKIAFETEIRLYSGEDPLDVWDRYVNWTVQMFPQEGKGSCLSELLEQVIDRFKDEAIYHNDMRFVGHCLKFASSLLEPIDLYNYMYSVGIGKNLARFYISWATEYEMQENYKQASNVITNGIQQNAQPLDKLHCYQRQLDSCLARRIITQMSEAQNEPEETTSQDEQRMAFTALKVVGKKAKAPVIRVGSTISGPPGIISMQSKSSGHQQQCKQMVIPLDESVFVLPQDILDEQPWLAPPTRTAQENDLKPKPWNKIRFSFHHQYKKNPSGGLHNDAPSRPSFVPYVDEPCANPDPSIPTPRKLHPLTNNVLSARKPAKSEGFLERIQNHVDTNDKTKVMYCKDKLDAGLQEFSMEELRAERYKQKICQKQMIHQNEIKAKVCVPVEKMEDSLQMERLQLHNEREKCGMLLEEVVKTLNEMKNMQVWPPVACLPVYSQGICTQDEVLCQQEPPLPLRKNIQEMPRKQNPVVVPSLQERYFLSSVGATSPPVDMERIWLLFAGCFQAHTAHNRSSDLFSQPDITCTQEDLDGFDPMMWNHTTDAMAPPNQTLGWIPENTRQFAQLAPLMSTPFSVCQDTHDDADENSETLLQSSDVPPEVFLSPLQLCFAEYPSLFFSHLCSPIVEISNETARSSSSSSCASITSLKTTPDTDSIGPQANHTGGCIVERPWNPCLIESLLSQLKTPLESLPNFFCSNECIPKINLTSKLQLGPTMYHVQSLVGDGAFAKVYCAVASKPDGFDEKVALKVQMPAHPWEFYMCTQLKARLSPVNLALFINVNSEHIYQNGSILVGELHTCGSLLDVANWLHQQTAKISHQALLLYMATTMLYVVEQLHMAGIIHTDIKPDNFVLTNRCVYALDCCMNRFQLVLIDFGQSIDLSLFPSGTVFKGSSETSAFQCIEMLTDQPWKFQPDYFGIASTMHCLIFGKYMEVYKDGDLWKMKSTLKRWHFPVWNHFFFTLLNARDCHSTDILADLRAHMLQFMKNDERTFQSHLMLLWPQYKITSSAVLARHLFQ